VHRLTAWRALSAVIADGMVVQSVTHCCPKGNDLEDVKQMGTQNASKRSATRAEALAIGLGCGTVRTPRMR
jgi:hypothetical protein